MLLMKCNNQENKSTVNFAYKTSMVASNNQIILLQLFATKSHKQTFLNAPAFHNKMFIFEQ